MADRPIFPAGADLTNQQIKNLLAGVDPSDAVNLSQLNAAVAGGVRFIGEYNATTNTPDLESPAPGAVEKGFLYVVSVAGDFFTEEVKPGDSLISKVDNPSGLSDWIIVEDNVIMSPDTILLNDETTTGSAKDTKISGVITEQTTGVYINDWFLVEVGGRLKKAKRQQFLPEVRGAVNFTRLDISNTRETTFPNNLNPRPILADTYVANTGAGIINMTQDLSSNRMRLTDQNPNAAKTWNLISGVMTFRRAAGGGASEFNLRLAINGITLNYPRAPFRLAASSDIVNVPVLCYTFGSVTGRTFEMWAERITGAANLILVGSNVGFQSLVSRQP